VLTYFRKVIKRELLPKTNIFNVIGGSTWSAGGEFMRTTTNDKILFGTKILLMSMIQQI
jgi:hypothetical protein